jgi:choline dehydrogenase
MRIVVCGAGTAGCIVASRLSEDPNNEVTLLEAGPHYRPGQWPAALSHSHRIIDETHDWGLRARAGESPRIVSVPRGRVVGGSSVTNGAIALRGHPEHYDEWDDWVDGFRFEDWLPWFRALERDRDFGSADHHGDVGPIAISRYPRPDWLELHERFAEAAHVRGHGWVDDHNEPGAIGVGPVPLNMIDGERVVPADTHLDPALERPNLTLVAGVTVDKVRLAANRTTAVEVVDGHGVTTHHTDRVVLALGTYMTPAVLMRSGIGPADELERHGIPVVLPLGSVGKDLQDHPKISHRFDLGLRVPEWPSPGHQALLTGEHAVNGERRVYQVLPSSGVSMAGHVVADLHVQVSDARSRRGRIRLQSRHPFAQPVIDTGWFGDPSDLDAAVAAGKRLVEVASAPPLSEVLAPWPHIQDPDHALRCVETFHHPVGSCRMGRPDDPGAVVDPTGAVIGLEGLHVVDASVFARIPSANTHLAVIALAERLAAAMLGRTRPPPAPVAWRPCPQ